MSSELFFPNPASRQRLRSGPLGPEIDGFAAWLASQGYSRHSARRKLRLVADLSGWLGQGELAVEALDERQVERFLLGRGLRHRQDGSAATCRQLLDFLRDAGRVPNAPPMPPSDSPIECVARVYKRFLVDERGVSLATAAIYLRSIRAFLTERFGSRAVVLESLSARDANQFVLRHAQRFSRSRAKLLVTALRSFLRHLHQRGDLRTDLADAVLPVMHWHLAGLPQSLAPEQVEAVLSACDRSTVSGLRDYAILLLLARLGLRAGEVAALTLDDCDWDQGIVTVTGKGRRREPLPLPSDVGEAVAEYLQHGRPRRATRHLFLRLQAPLRGLSSSGTVSHIVRRALARAAIDLPCKGAHLLRHSLATNMLGNGASLEDIGQILRHRHPETTQIYAKVDLNALRLVAPRWPGGAA